MQSGTDRLGEHGEAEGLVTDSERIAELEARLTNYQRQQIRDKRASRECQQRKRGAKPGIATQLENALMLLAWEAGEVSEGQMAKILDMGRIEVRTLRADKIDDGCRIAEALHEPHAKRAIREARRKLKLRHELESLDSESTEA